MPARWRNASAAGDVAAKLESAKKADPSGSVSFGGWEVDEWVATLGDSLLLSEQIPDYEKHRIVWQSISAAGKVGRITGRSIVAEAAKLERSYLAARLEPYVLVTSVSLPPAAEVPRFHVYGTTITFPRSLPLALQRHRYELVETTKLQLLADPPSRYLNVRVHTRGRSSYSAAELALRTLDEIRGMWNLDVNRRVLWASSSGRLRPVNRIVLGPIHSLHRPSGKLADGGHLYEPLYHGELPLYSRREDIEGILTFTLRIRRWIRQIPYRQDFSSWFVRYARAFDEVDRITSFIKLWSLLEDLTITGEREPHALTVERGSFVFRDRAYHRGILDQLREARNYFVHEGGTREDTERLLYQLKRYVEVLLLFHVSHGKRFGSKENVRDFLSLPSDKNMLTKRAELINFAQQFLKGG